MLNSCNTLYTFWTHYHTYTHHTPIYFGKIHTFISIYEGKNCLTMDIELAQTYTLRHTQTTVMRVAFPFGEIAYYLTRYASVWQLTKCQLSPKWLLNRKCEFWIKRMEWNRTELNGTDWSGQRSNDKWNRYMKILHAPVPALAFALNSTETATKWTIKKLCSKRDSNRYDYYRR